MASKWSQATLLRRIEQEYKGLYSKDLIDGETGEPTETAEVVTLAEFVKLISRQIVVEQMTGRRSKVSEDGEG